MLPFTHSQFIADFAAYNAATWPAPVAAYLLAVLIGLHVLGFRPRSGRLVPVALAAMWLWTAVVYHLLFFSVINRAALFFGAAFALQSVLFLVAALRGQLVFGQRASGVQKTFGWLLIVYAAVVYPIAGTWSGLSWPGMPAFGVTPCPLVLFTVGVLLLAREVRWWLLVIPVAWSLIGGSAAWLLKMPQDWPLLLVPAAAVLILARQRHVRAGLT